MRKIAFAAAGVLLSVGLLSPTQALAVDQVNTEKLRKAVTVADILQHERAFQRIANDNDGTRASGTPGYNASADYVVRKLRQAGYQVQRQTFTFPFFQELAPAELSEVSPTARTLRQGPSPTQAAVRSPGRSSTNRHPDPAGCGAQQHFGM